MNEQTDQNPTPRQSPAAAPQARPYRSLAAQDPDPRFDLRLRRPRVTAPADVDRPDPAPEEGEAR